MSGTPKSGPAGDAEKEMVGSAAADPEEPAGRRVISDSRTMRALAHPVRIALLEILGREGQLTATAAADILDESPGNMSWHLQTLAKYGYVEEAGGGKGRSRPWRIVSTSNRFRSSSEDPEFDAAGEALGSTFAERAFARLREWLGRNTSYSFAWRDAAFISDSLAYLTAEEMAEVGEEVTKIFSRFQDRVLDKSLRPAGAEPTQLIAFGHPIPPTPSGN